NSYAQQLRATATRKIRLIAATDGFATCATATGRKSQQRRTRKPLDQSARGVHQDPSERQARLRSATARVARGTIRGSLPSWSLVSQLLRILAATCHLLHPSGYF